MSLRARLVLVLAVLSTVGLVVAAVVTYAELRSFLLERVDRSLDAGTLALERSLERRTFAAPRDFEQLAQLTPGMFVEIRDDDGETVWSGSLTRPGEASPVPELPAELPVSVGAEPARTTVAATDGSTDFRVEVVSLRFGTLIVAAPLNDVDETLDRLLVIEVIVAASVVAAVVVLALVLVRIGLRPLRRIEETAGAIVSGRLDRRVEGATERTEVGRLGLALNAMLSRIEEAFAEKEASEARLRRFVADASHELRTPLASVRAYAELFRRGAKDNPDDLARAMSGIEREATRMGFLVDDLLLLARLDQGRPLQRRPVDLVEVAVDAVDAARALAPERTIVLAAEGPVIVTGDPDRLRQVVDNLLTNVRTHTPVSAQATVRVSVSEDRTAVIEVVDEGPGLTEAEKARVFERFYRADPSRSRDGGGTGLGLAIVAAIADAHGGSATVESAPGQGATFRIVLPCAPAGPAEPEASPEEALLEPVSE